VRPTLHSMTLGLALALFLVGLVLVLLFGGILNTLGVLLILAGIVVAVIVLLTGSRRL
jgi:hypothetical protein